MMAQIKAAVERKIRATKPTLIACSDPVALGLFMNWDQRSATIDKTRGGVYDYDGIKVIIVTRSEEHTSELQSLMRISYAVFCLNKKKNTKNNYQYSPKQKQLR